MNADMSWDVNLNFIVLCLYWNVTVSHFVLEQEVQTFGSETKKNSGNSPCILQAWKLHQDLEGNKETKNKSTKKVCC